ncbi:lytic transglycosylase domain-containing protein [candidate division WOR-3 bacterium]|nr:lytic transglycosylase domain-containing protein [candidate division WOR-3 bacterium]
MIFILIFGQMISHTETGNVLITNIPQVESSGTSNTVTECTTYNHIIKHYCQHYGVDQELVKLVIEKESQFNPNAVSRSGAIGLMQLMPATAEILGVKDPYNPRANIMGGVKYLRHLFDTFDDDIELTLAAYHAGPSKVKKLNRVPSIPETMEYVDYIISRYGAADKKNPIYFSLTEEGTPFFTNRPK